MKTKPRLTKKQNETRLRGLRILARMIVRAHLASLREEAKRKGSEGCIAGSSPSDRENPGGEAVHGG